MAKATLQLQFLLETGDTAHSGLDCLSTQGDQKTFMWSLNAMCAHRETITVYEEYLWMVAQQ